MPRRSLRVRDGRAPGCGSRARQLGAKSSQIWASFPKPWSREEGRRPLCSTRADEGRFRCEPADARREVGLSWPGILPANRGDRREVSSYPAPDAGARLRASKPSTAHFDAYPATSSIALSRIPGVSAAGFDARPSWCARPMPWPPCSRRSGPRSGCGRGAAFGDAHPVCGRGEANGPDAEAAAPGADLRPPRRAAARSPGALG